MTTGPRIPRPPQLPGGNLPGGDLPGGMNQSQWNAFLKRQRANKLARDAAQRGMAREAERPPSLEQLAKIREYEAPDPSRTGGAKRKWLNRLTGGPVEGIPSPLEAVMKYAPIAGEVGAATNLGSGLRSEEQEAELERRTADILGLPKVESEMSWLERQKTISNPIDYLKARREAYLEVDMPFHKRIIGEIAFDPLTYTGIGAISKIPKIVTAFKAGFKGKKIISTAERKLAYEIEQKAEKESLDKLAPYSDEAMESNPTFFHPISDHASAKGMDTISNAQVSGMVDKVSNWVKSPFGWTMGKLKNSNKTEKMFAAGKTLLKRAEMAYLKLEAAAPAMKRTTIVEINKPIDGQSLNEAFHRSGNTIGDTINKLKHKMRGTTKEGPKGINIGDDGIVHLGDKPLGVIERTRKSAGKVIKEKVPATWAYMFSAAFKVDIFEEVKRLGKLTPKQLKGRKVNPEDWTDAQWAKAVNPVFKDLNKTQLKFIARSQLLIEEGFTQITKVGGELGTYIEKSKLAHKLAGKRYFPRVLDTIGRNVGGKGKFAKQSFEKRRKVLDEDMYDGVVEGKLNYDTDPLSAIDTFIDSILKKSRQTVITNDMKRISKMDNSPFRYAGKGKERELINRIIRNITEKGTKTGITQKTINQVKLAFPHLAKELEKGLIPKSKATKIFADEDAIETWVKSAKKQINYSNVPNKVGVIPGYNGVSPKMFERFIFIGPEKTATKNAKKFADRMGITDPKEIRGRRTFEFFGQVGDVMRLGMTGLDLGFFALQGLPPLAKAVLKIPYDRRWIKAYGESVKQTFRTALSPKAFDDFIRQNKEVVREGINHGLEMGRTSSDIFEGFGILGKAKIPTPLGTIPIGKPFGLIGGVAERAFVNPADVIRINGFKIYRENAAIRANGDPTILQELLKQQASFLNKLTGALNSLEQGVGPTQRAVERAILFFSPRYTRSSVSMVGDMFRSGVTGSQARKSIAEIMGFGLFTYLTIAELRGEDPRLDPTEPGFLQWRFGDDYVGPGTIWVQMARLVLNTSDDALDFVSQVASGALDPNSEEYERLAKNWKLWDLDMLYNNPIMRWIRGRTSPVYGIVEGAVTNKDFMGRDIEGNPALLNFDWWLDKLPTPMWADNLFMGDAFGNKMGKEGAIAEFFGLRGRPLSPSQLRQETRDQLSMSEHEVPFDKLNKLQQLKLSKDNQVLQDFDEEVERYYENFPPDTENQMDKFNERTDLIDNQYNKAVEDSLEALNNDDADTAVFRKLIQSAGAVKRANWKTLKEDLAFGGNLEVAGRYLEKQDKRKDKQILDVAYQEYISTIIANDDFESPRGYDFAARDEAIKRFVSDWGSETYNEVQELLSLGQDIPDILEEYYNGLKEYQWYWEQAQEGAFKEQPNELDIRQEYMKWTNALDAEKLKMEKNNPQIKSVHNLMAQIRLGIRRENRGVDFFVVRWGMGGADTFQNFQNKQMIDGLGYARRSEPIDLDLYDSGPTY